MHEPVPHSLLAPVLDGADALVGHDLQSVADALPDERAAATALNRLLASAGVALVADDSVWRVRVLGIDGRPSASHEIALALAAVVSDDGWRRIKRCARAGCAASFLDRTNGVTRKYCAVHRAPSARTASTDAPR